MTRPHVHFVGFRRDAEYWSAVHVWGVPDFIHKWHDVRMWGDIDDERDIVIFAKCEDPDKPRQYSWQDHAIW